jgi:ribosomal protein S12 methylthiotransferase accessory factor YcaO
VNKGWNLSASRYSDSSFRPINSDTCHVCIGCERVEEFTLTTALLVTLVLASAVPATARVEQAAQNAATEAQSSEQTIVQAAKQAVGEAEGANRAKPETKSQKRHKSKEKTEQQTVATEQETPETGGFLTASNMVLLGEGATTIVVGGVLLRRVLG